jgi:Kdo2-lipid IVA lauroyltransferase/acyltransferase
MPRSIRVELQPLQDAGWSQGAVTRIVLGLMWLLHWLPFRIIGVFGAALGYLLYAINHERRKVTFINLQLCFPQLDDAERTTRIKQHFVAFARSALEHSLLWWASPVRLKRLVRLEGYEYLQTLEGQPVILLAPHFVGLDVGWTRLALEHDMVTMYARIKNAAFDAALCRGRERFGQQQLVSRQDGLRRVIAAIREGTPFYYLPDMDYGARDAVFVPFFGVNAATITTMSRLTRISGAKVLMVVTRRHADGYVVSVSESWPDFPGADIEADTLRMNQAIEAAVQSGDSAEYFWSHKRFKTRPPGEKGVY